MLHINNMSRIKQLNLGNFQIHGRQKKTLITNVPGLCVVFFEMTNCEGCADFKPIFTQYAHTEGRINTFATCNVTGPNRQIAEMSKGTTSPISTVPHVLLYNNGYPFARFTGRKTIQGLQSFIDRALQELPANETNIEPEYSAEQPAYYRPPQQPLGNQTLKGNKGAKGPPAGMYGGPGPGNGGKPWMPELASSPNIGNAVRGGTQGYQTLGMVEEQDEMILALPEAITPHNTPWESIYKEMGQLG